MRLHVGLRAAITDRVRMARQHLRSSASSRPRRPAKVHVSDQRSPMTQATAHHQRLPPPADIAI